MTTTRAVAVISRNAARGGIIVIADAGRRIREYLGTLSVGDLIRVAREVRKDKEVENGTSHRPSYIGHGELTNDPPLCSSLRSVSDSGAQLLLRRRCCHPSLGGWDDGSGGG